jgi:hypothetical protein
MLATTVDFKFELETVALIQRGHASAFYGRDVDECIRLSVVALNEAEALHCVEELDRAAGFFTGQLALRCVTATKAATSTTARGRSCIAIAWRAAIGNSHRLAINLKIGCRDASATIDEGEAQRLTFRKTGETGLLDCRDVNENVFGTIIANDKAETFLPVEEFYNASAFTNDLCRHSAASTAAGEPAAAAAATAAEPVAAASETAAVAAAAAAFIAAEAVAFVASTSAAFAATTSIETHALPYSFENNRPLTVSRTHHTGRRAAVPRRESIKRQ